MNVIESAIVSAPSRPDPEAPDATAGRRAIDAERLRLFNRQVVRAPVGVLFAAVFIGHMMAPHVGAGTAWGWASVAAGIWIVRALVSAALLAHPPQQLGGWIRFLAVSSTASGVVAGSAAILFFRAPPLEWAMLTMVLCAWCAAGIAISATLPTAFYGLATCFLAPLAAAWVVSEMPLRVPVAGLILFFLFYLIVFARDGSQLMERALRAGFENEELARRLHVREAEAQAARARAEEASLAKSRFLAAASHDLRQPLHSLSLLLDHAVHTSTDPQVEHILQQATRSADSLGRLFTGLLDLSRLDAGSLTAVVRPVSLKALLRWLENDFRSLAQEKGLALDCDTPDAWVCSDPAMLERMLRNLLHNAVKYTEAGRIELRAVTAELEVRLSVHDTGIGIAPADRDRIFEEYFQVRNPARDRSRGVGLGLAIVKRMGQLLGHAIEVETEPGRGSTFTVTVPRCEPPGSLAASPRASSLAAEDAATPQASLDALRGTVVVVIEDDADVSEAMATLLRDWGCQAVVAGGSAGAIAQLDAAGLAPDAILADWRLGGDENGLQAIERLNARFGERPAAIVTGEISPADLQVPRQMSVSVLQKPVRAREISTWLLSWKSIE